MKKRARACPQGQTVSRAKTCCVSRRPWPAVLPEVWGAAAAAAQAETRLTHELETRLAFKIFFKKKTIIAFKILKRKKGANRKDGFSNELPLEVFDSCRYDEDCPLKAGVLRLLHSRTPRREPYSQAAHTEFQ